MWSKNSEKCLDETIMTPVAGIKKHTSAPLNDCSYIDLQEQHLVPNLNHHDAIEQMVISKLLDIEQDFRKCYERFQKELAAQKELVGKLWHLTQRFRIIRQVEDSCKTPIVYAVEPEEEIMGEYNLFFLEIKNLNYKFGSFVAKFLRPNVLLFRKYCSQLDFTQERMLITGDAFHKPISFFIKLVEDLFNYFHSYYLKLDYSYHQLDPVDLTALETYSKLLERNEEFEDYLMNALTYCKCFQPLEPCPPVPEKEKTEPPLPKTKASRVRDCYMKRRLQEMPPAPLSQRNVETLLGQSLFSDYVQVTLLNDEQLDQ